MGSKCLVVDDEPDVERLILQRFRHEIRDGKLHFRFAGDGEEALDILKTDMEIDLILTDINMPRMDGLTLLGHIQDINPIARTVVVSAYGDLANLRASMNKGAFDFVVKPIDFDDLRLTLEKTLGFVAQTKEALHQSRQNSILKMYVNPSIVHFLRHSAAHQTTHESVEANRRINGTVMFVDICGFTRLSEVLSPDLLGAMLNSYFDEIATSALEFNGTIDKFIGDAAMIVFQGERHLWRAAHAAFAILDRIGAFRGRALGETDHFPGVSIGINSGEMISGTFGSQQIQRLDFTVIGDVVNTAARLESAAGDGEIFLAQELAQSLASSFTSEFVGELSLKNKGRPMPIHRLLGPVHTGAGVGEEVANAEIDGR